MNHEACWTLNTADYFRSFLSEFVVFHYASQFTFALDAKQNIRLPESKLST